MENYVIDFRKVRTNKGIEYDVCVTTASCNREYVGQFKSLKDAHKTIKIMLKNGILF